MGDKQTRDKTRACDRMVTALARLTDTRALVAAVAADPTGQDALARAAYRDALQTAYENAVAEGTAALAEAVEVQVDANSRHDMEDALELDPLNIRL